MNWKALIQKPKPPLLVTQVRNWRESKQLKSKSVLAIWLPPRRVFSKKCANESWTWKPKFTQFHAPSPTPFETGLFEKSIDKTTTQNSKKNDALGLSNPVKSLFIQPKDSTHVTRHQGQERSKTNTSLMPIRSRRFINGSLQNQRVRMRNSPLSAKISIEKKQALHTIKQEQWPNQSSTSNQLRSRNKPKAVVNAKPKL